MQVGTCNVLARCIDTETELEHCTVVWSNSIVRYRDICWFVPAMDRAENTEYRIWQYEAYRYGDIRFIRWIYGAASSPDVRGAARHDSLSLCYHLLAPATSASLALPYARPGPTRANQASPQRGQPFLRLARASGHSGRAWNQRGSAAQLQGPTPTGGGHRASPNRASHLCI